jgi:hypothetical protein
MSWSSFVILWSVIRAGVSVSRRQRQGIDSTIKRNDLRCDTRQQMGNANRLGGRGRPNLIEFFVSLDASNSALS